MNVAQWLNAIDLGQYETVFREHEIDAGVLCDLVEADLEKIGVPLGHRKRLLKAIAALGTRETASKPPSPAPASSPAAAERRPITVMFCDLVGSTSMAEKLDAEDWRTLVNTYLDEASAAVTGLGGHVLKKLGDGLMALFGYPHAQENDAERAVRAALAIQRALVEINARNTRRGAPELSARIGLDSGQVVVDATGEVFGDAPNIAARVQSAAEPGSILITATVQRQTAGLFVAEDCGQHELKGVSAPMTLYRVVRASGGGRRGGARALTPLVGREEELDLLSRRWDRARKGEGQLALIVGEPGLGKSRLMEEFHGRLGEAPHTWVEWSSSQLLQNTPLHPIAEWGRQRFGVDLPTKQRLADFENTLELVGLDPTEYAPLLAPLVDVPLPEDRAAKLAPEELRRRQLAAMTAWILASARTQPVVLAFEDLHWADPTSLDLMRALAERGAQAPLLIIATARPEFRPPWSVRSHHSAISLSPLDRMQIAKMVSELSARHALPRDIVEGVSERTGGVPLFVEEVTRLLLERGEQGGSQAIPPTLQQSLAARLDRLGSARETAQIGAVLGRGFSYELLQSVAGLDEGALQSALERLTQADILFVEGDGPQANYRFKHALIQDAAYESLLKSRRQALHHRAAELLRDQPERAAAEPEAVAHHFTQAGLDDLAIEWWGKAGDQALRRSAFQEAIAHLGKAIAMADKAAGGKEADGTAPAPSSPRLKLQSDYGRAVMWSKGFAADETKAAFDRARELADGTESAAERFHAYYAQWVRSYFRGEHRQALSTAETFLREAEKGGYATEAGVARRCLGTICLHRGDLKEARTHLERALADYAPNRDAQARFRFGHDTGVAAAAYLSWATWQMGEVERARRLAEQAVQSATDLGHAPSTAQAHHFKTLLEKACDDPAAALRSAETLLVLAREHRMDNWIALGELYAAWARGRLDDPEAGAQALRRALEGYLNQGNRMGAPSYHGWLAELEARRRDPAAAQTLIDRGLAIAEETGERLAESYLHLLRGTVLLRRDPDNPAPAEQSFQIAIAIAKDRGARSSELLASLALAKLYQSTDRSAEAHAVLAPALEGFSPTPEMRVIAKAQALLAVLADTEEVKADAAQQRQRLHLQTAYGRAVMWSKGFGSDEARAAFDRAQELTKDAGNVDERFATLYGLFVTSLVRGELRTANEAAETFRREAESCGRLTEAAVAGRFLGLISSMRGELLKSKAQLEEALRVYDPERDRDTRFRYGIDTAFGATLYLAPVTLMLGDIEGARKLIDESVARAVESDRVQDLVNAYNYKEMHEISLGDAEAALRSAEIHAEICRRHQVEPQSSFRLHSAWARARLGDRKIGMAQLRQALAASMEGNEKLGIPRFQGLLAELEAEEQDFEGALARIDKALAIAHETGNHLGDAFLHRLRGEILLKRDPANHAPAEEAFLTAVAVAKQQHGRFYGLRAALSLAKLYQSTSRSAEAYAVLAPALEGFAPTAELPEIAEAQALLAGLADAPPDEKL